MLTDDQKQILAQNIVDMVSSPVTVTPVADAEDGGPRFLIESRSQYPILRIAGKLKRRGCTIELVGNSKKRIIRFPAR